MKTLNLKHCPLCGGEPELNTNGCDDLSYHISQAWVECGSCEYQSNTVFNNNYDEKSSEECINKANHEWNNSLLEVTNYENTSRR